MTQKNTEAQTAKKQHVSHANQPTVIGENCRITGDIELDGDAQISGIVDGQIELTGKMTITLGGTVTGSVQANRLDLEGQIEGDVICENLLRLSDSAVLQGNVYAQSFAVEEGATCRGHVVIGPHALEAAAQRLASDEEEEEFLLEGSTVDALRANEDDAPIGRIAAGKSSNTRQTAKKEESGADVATTPAAAGLLRRRSSLLSKDTKKHAGSA